MESSKILSADLLDILFDDRNKEYGAYELRRTYNKRIKKALLFTLTIAALVLTGSVLARTLKPERDKSMKSTIVTITELPPEIQKPEPLPEQPQPEPEPVRTEQLTTFDIVDDNQVEEPPPTKDDLDSAMIGLKDQEGSTPTGIVDEPLPVGEGSGIIDTKKNEEPEDFIHPIVQVEARFAGNWEKFLLRHLNPEVPAENGAPTGRYTVRIQFVVDKEGNVSDIKALTNIGYGLEEESIRVLRKADKWEPAIQNGYKVKAYRVQLITFEVNE
ncbi:MAG TPA: energy transducer TonB [Chitinophagaceae bacterium]|nr:energy transducer TonB [Chitinophagaceae bacterium]